MSDVIHSNLLWFAVAWPLLLALPALHSRLPWPRYLAILPATLLVALPGESSLQLSRLVFGTGLAVDTQNRWILAMTVTVWLLAAIAAKRSQRSEEQTCAGVFFMLTLAGNLGMVLADDLVSFFSFATLMGYSFYALLVQQGDENVRHAGRLYMLFLIIADLALFEALLLVASDTETMQFEAAGLVMAGAPAAEFYLWMTLVAFAFKSGAWPAHLWLAAAFNSASRSTALLLGAVPVAMAWLGAVRWLPLGEQSFYLSGIIVLLIGLSGVLYAALRLYTHRAVTMLPAWAGIAVSGLLFIVLGAGLVEPALWQAYEHLVYPSIALSGIALAIAGFIVNRVRDTPRQADAGAQHVEAIDLWSGLFMQRINGRIAALSSIWYSTRLQALKHYQQVLDYQISGAVPSGWRLAITLFVLLGLALAWLAT